MAIAQKTPISKSPHKRLGIYLPERAVEQVALIRVTQGLATDSAAIMWAVNAAARSMPVTNSDRIEAARLLEDDA